ncbi:YopX family protein [Streptococcus anginosus]|uniref:YopX family protein n=1 Tax=Streptococcus anginosus TaxID=1328 RepID=UPI0020009F37|nr:YopX family protein [Streptococcus anginosus]
MITRFRAWDILAEEMIDEMLLISYVRKEIVGKYRNGTTSVPLKFEDDRNGKDVALMRSTGLKDLNGVEIFEGDIITTSAYGCIVGFGEYTYFEDENTPTTEIGFYLSFLNVKPATYAPFDKYYWDNCEVIGNIYENELDLILYEAHKYNKSKEKE